MKTEDKLLKYMFYGFCGFLLYLWFLSPDKVLGSIENNTTTLSPVVFEIKDNSEGYILGECDLSFYSYRDFKIVSTPVRFFDSLTKSYSCKDLQTLTKIAHYESEWGTYMQDPTNEYAKGIYKVLPKTRYDECQVKYGIYEEDQCALFVMQEFPGWYLMGYGTAGFDKSF